MIILKVWREQPGKYFCLSTKSGTGKWKDTFFTKKEFDEVDEFIKDNKDKDVYFCPHGFSKPRRHKSCAILPNLLWSDMDEADPSQVKPKPTIAIESSPNRFVGLWRIDEEMTEDLNRQLSYAIGADKSGWDLSQVLRVPGTHNYKYHNAPRVKLLWIDGPEYQASKIRKMLPEPEKPLSSTDVSEIFHRYERKLPRWVRKELIAGRPQRGQRSDMIWKLEHTLLECGLTTDEAFALIKASPWNKFRGRRNEDDQLRNELSKAVGQHLNGTTHEISEGSELLFVNMADVEEEHLDWLYYPYLARGELTILEGDPGLGKSYLAQMIAGAICDGRKLPAVKKHRPVEGRVVYFDIENSAGTVTKKRLVWNNVKNLHNYIQCEEPFSIDDEETMDEIYDELEKYRPKLVVFDTLNTYLGKADAFKGHEAQQAFVHFRDIALRFNCAVLVLRHLTKSTKEKALYRGQGSIAFAGLARVVMTVGISPEDPDTRVMAVNKINVTRAPKALEFRIVDLPDSLKEQDRSRFEWGDFVDLRPDDILGAAPSKSSEREDAKGILEELLEEGPVELKKLERMCEARSVSKRTLYRAAEELGVIKASSGFGRDKHAVWELP